MTLTFDPLRAFLALEEDGVDRQTDTTPLHHTFRHGRGQRNKNVIELHNTLCVTFFQETVACGSPSATQGITTDCPG